MLDYQTKLIQAGLGAWVPNPTPFEAGIAGNKAYHPVLDPMNGQVLGYRHPYTILGVDHLQIVDRGGTTRYQGITGERGVEQPLIDPIDVLQELGPGGIINELGQVAVKSAIKVGKDIALKAAARSAEGRLAKAAAMGAGAIVSGVDQKLGQKVLGSLEQTAGKELEKAGEKVGQTAGKELEKAGEKVGQTAGEDAEHWFSATFNANDASGFYQTTQRLIRGNLGERLAADALAEDGHLIIAYKPSILGTNRGGIDIVTYGPWPSKADPQKFVVYLIDNKALTKGGNVASVSSLTTNLTKNVAGVERQLLASLSDPARSPAERQVLNDALDALRQGRYIKAVTNANAVDLPAQVLSGVTKQLEDNHGIKFIPVFPSKPIE
jgi:hypothetical protein